MNNSYSDFLRPAGAAQALSFTASGAQQIASAIPPGAAGVWVFVTSDAFVKVNQGTNTVLATSQSIPLAARWPVILPLDVNNGDVKVSVVADLAGGRLFVLPVAAC